MVDKKNYAIRFTSEGVAYYHRPLHEVFALTFDADKAGLFDLDQGRRLASYLHLGSGRSDGWYCVRDGVSIGINHRRVIMDDRGATKAVIEPSGVVVEIVDVSTNVVVATI